MKKINKGICLILVAILTLLSFVSTNLISDAATAVGTADGALSVEFCKLGEADSILLEQDGNFILVDVGTAETSDTVISTLNKRNVSKLQAIIITHYDKDHVEAIQEIVNHMKGKEGVGKVYARFYNKTELQKISTYKNKDGKAYIFVNYIKFVNAVISIYNSTKSAEKDEIAKLNDTDDVKTVYLRALDVYNISGIWKSPDVTQGNLFFGDKSSNAKIEWKNSVKSYFDSDLPKDMKIDISNLDDFKGVVNNDSLVFRIVTKSGNKLLFLGDLGTTGIKNLVKNSKAYPIDCDVLKISHHGRRYSTSQDLLNATKPDYSIITCDTIKGEATLTEDTSSRLKTLDAVYKGFGKLYYVGTQSGASSTITVTGKDKYNLGTLYRYKANDDVSADFSKIGEADSILLEQDGKFILVDVGLAKTSDTVISTLKKREVSKLQAIIITHYDSDHVGAIQKVVDYMKDGDGKIRIDNVYARFYSEEELQTINENEKKLKKEKEITEEYISRNYKMFVNAVISIINSTKSEDQKEIPKLKDTDDVKTVYERALLVYNNDNKIWKSPYAKNSPNEDFIFGNAKIEWKNRAESYFKQYYNYKKKKVLMVKNIDVFMGEVNNDSLVFRVVTKSGLKLLFLGDIKKAGIENLVKSKGDYPIDCDVLKISHHGRKLDTTKDLLKATTPKYSIITCGTEEGNGNLTKIPSGTKIDKSNSYKIRQRYTSSRLQDLYDAYEGFGAIYYVGTQNEASSAITVTGKGEYRLGTLYKYEYKKVK